MDIENPLSIRISEILPHSPRAEDYVLYRTWNGKRGRYIALAGKLEHSIFPDHCIVDKCMVFKQDIFFAIKQTAHTRLCWEALLNTNNY